MTEAERDARDLNLHRVMENYFSLFATQFGLTRSQAADHWECFLENEREESSYRRAHARACQADAEEGA